MEQSEAAVAAIYGTMSEWDSELGKMRKECQELRYEVQRAIHIERFFGVIIIVLLGSIWVKLMFR